MKKTKLIATLMMSLVLVGCKTPNAEVRPLEAAEIHMAKINDTTYEVTATVYPLYATDKHLTWSLAWAPDASSSTDDDAWKGGKTVANYLDLAVNEDTSKATVTLTEAFASQVILTAKLTNKPTVKAETKIEYQKRINQAYNSNYNLVPATSVNFVNPYTYSDSIGTIPHNKTITYQYSNKFYFYGGSQTTPVEWTEEVNATRGTGGSQQQVNIVNAIPVRIAGVTTANFNFKTEGTYVFSGAFVSESVLDDLAYAILEGTTTQVTTARSKGAKLAIGVKTFIDGVQKSTGTGGSDWTMVQIDFTGYQVTATSISVTDTTIIF